MGPKEAKYYRDLLETIGIKFKSKGTRLKGPQYYGIEDTEMTSPLSNKEFSRRNFALTEEGKIIPAGSPALIPTEVYPTPKGAITSIATDELAMRNPWLGLIGGAIMSKGKRFSDNTPDTRMYPKYPDGYSKGYGYQDTPYLYPTKRNPDFEPVIQHNKLPQMSRFQIPMAPPRQKIDLDPQQRITMNALERAEGRTRALLAKDKQVILDNNQNPVVVPQSELMERLDSQLKNPLFGNYPWFQEGTVDLGGGNTMYNFNQVPGFGALRNVPDKKAKNTDVDIYFKNIINIITGKSNFDIDKLRENMYNITTRNIDKSLIFSRINEMLFKLNIDDAMKLKTVSLISKYECRNKLCYKDIIHLEGLIINLTYLFHNINI